MVGKALETLFIKVWVIVKLNLFFWLFSVCGLLVAGVGPALKTVNELFITHEFNYKEITLKEGWKIFKKNSIRGNVLFYATLLLLAVLAYNLFLSVQIQGLAFLMIDFLLVFAMIYGFVTYQYTLLLDSYYEIGLKNLLKLAFISTLSNFTNLLKIAIGISVILFVTWKFKGLILFGTVSMIQIWSFTATKSWRQTIDQRLELHA
ncbi:YesL family protein [Enterococcus rotai]|uniref:YesL family protein n=1 Tax=Enterococcus rotai TaxID=118060 RepID=UPI0032B3C51E